MLGRPHPLAGLLALVLAVLSPGAEGECTAYSSALCGDVIDTYASGQVYGDQFVLAVTEGFLVNAGLQNISIAGPILFPECYDIARRFICGNYFPECSTNNTKIPICQSICTDFYSKCAVLLESGDYPLPTCDSFPTENCSVTELLPPLDVSSVVCPSPLIPNWDGVERETCPGGVCCIPCPPFPYFFPEGQMDKNNMGIKIVGVLVSIPTLMLWITYLILPTRRKYPQRMITYLISSILLSFLNPYIGISVNDSDVLCHSEIEPVSFGNSTTLCTVEGFILIFSSLSIIMWLFCITFNALLVIQWRYQTGWKEEIAYSTLSWGLPLICASVLAAYEQYSMDSSSFCSVPNQAWSNGAFFIPAAIFLFPAFFINVYVFGKVYMISRRVKRSIVKILKMQFRPLLFCSFGIFVFLLFWMYVQVYKFYYGWQQDWFLCIALGYGQNQCSEIATAYVDLTFITIIRYLLMVLALIAFAIFFVRKEVLRDWLKILSGSKPMDMGDYATTTDTKANDAQPSGMTKKSQSQSQSISMTQDED